MIFMHKPLMAKTSFKPIRAFLGENDTLAPLLAHQQSLSHLQQTFVDALPAHLHQSGRIAAMEGSTIVIAAANGAVAAVLKQMLPRLLAKFRENQKQEQEVTGIRVVVQPTIPADADSATGACRQARPREPMPIASLNQLADSLGDSPLKDTVARLSRRRARTTPTVK
jgi:hypothetical protein